MPALYERQRRAKLFHGDETRWDVFEEGEGQTGHRWDLGGMHSAAVVFYRMAPGRGADGPQAHVAKWRQALVDVVRVWDRDSAYQCLAKDHDDRIVADCWVPVRRDCRKAARRWPELESWRCAWVDDIRAFYRLHAARLEGWEEPLPLDQPPAACAERQRDLETPRSQMQARCEAHLQEPDLHLAQPKVLRSLPNHWDGLTGFVERPAVAMENNTAERLLRHPVVGRKNSYGSGSVWRAQLAAMMFSVLQTILLGGLKPPHWRSAFLQTCAESGGQSPADLSSFLPWQMPPERREELVRPVPVTWPPFARHVQDREEPEAADTS